MLPAGADEGKGEVHQIITPVLLLTPVGFDSDGRFVQLCFDGGEALDLSEPHYHPTWPPLSTDDQEWPRDSAERLSHWQMMSLAEAQQHCSSEGVVQEVQQGQQQVQQQLKGMLEAMSQVREGGAAIQGMESSTGIHGLVGLYDLHSWGGSTLTA